MNTLLKSLVYEQCEVKGVVVEKDGVRSEIRAGSVILTSGGFASNNKTRQKYHPHPIGKDLTLSTPGDFGDAIQVGMEIGADTALMVDAWWGPCFIDQNGKSSFMIWERSFPYSIIHGAYLSQAGFDHKARHGFRHDRR